MVNIEIRLIISFAVKDGEALHSQQKQDQELTVAQIMNTSDHEHLIAKFKVKLKKVEKITRPFRYDLNQIPDDYTLEVRNIFKGLDVIDRVPDELWTEAHDIIKETGSKTITKKKEMQKSKMAALGGLKNSCENNRGKRQRRKGKIYPFECRVPKNIKER